jgi:hypothetical protein
VSFKASILSSGRSNRLRQTGSKNNSAMARLVRLFASEQSADEMASDDDVDEGTFVGSEGEEDVSDAVVINAFKSSILGSSSTLAIATLPPKNDATVSSPARSTLSLRDSVLSSAHKKFSINNILSSGSDSLADVRMNQPLLIGDSAAALIDLNLADNDALQQQQAFHEQLQREREHESAEDNGLISSFYQIFYL